MAWRHSGSNCQRGSNQGAPAAPILYEFRSSTLEPMGQFAWAIWRFNGPGADRLDRDRLHAAVAGQLGNVHQAPQIVSIALDLELVGSQRHALAVWELHLIGPHLVERDDIAGRGATGSHSLDAHRQDRAAQHARENDSAAVHQVDVQVASGAHVKRAGHLGEVVGVVRGDGCRVLGGVRVVDYGKVRCAMAFTP